MRWPRKKNQHRIEHIVVTTVCILHLCMFSGKWIGGAYQLYGRSNNRTARPTTKKHEQCNWHLLGKTLIRARIYSGTMVQFIGKFSLRMHIVITVSVNQCVIGYV